MPELGVAPFLDAIAKFLGDVKSRWPQLFLILAIVTVLTFLSILIQFVTTDVWGLIRFLVTVAVVVALFLMAAWFVLRYGPKKTKAVAPPPAPPVPPPPLAPLTASTTLQESRERRLGLTAMIIAAGLGVVANFPTLVQSFSDLNQALFYAGLDKLQSASCLIRPFEPCSQVLDAIAPPEKSPPELAATLAAPAPASTIDRSAYTVYVQHDGLPRDATKALTTALHDRGWKVPDFALGGERTTAADGLAEVRYGSDEDRAAASQLANEISPTKLTATPLTTKRLSIVKKGVLEVWISG